MAPFEFWIREEGLVVRMIAFSNPSLPTADAWKWPQTQVIEGFCSNWLLFKAELY
jgi:hypothetical protein